MSPALLEVFTMVARRGHGPYPSHCRIVVPDVAPKGLFFLNWYFSGGYHVYVVYQNMDQGPRHSGESTKKSFGLENSLNFVV